MTQRYSKAELEAIDEHKYLMSVVVGHDVGVETAIRDWEENQAPKWRRERHLKFLELQRQEIQRYKWLESEKARCDLGTQASLDWINKHAAQWREWYDG